jgi:HK97 family phage prohead protease
MQHKTFTAEVVQRGESGGRILITTNSVDRDRDRVEPKGVILDNYLNNPVVMWGHSYSNPADVIGRATALEVTDSGIIADFELRPAANDFDPQNIVKLLWDGGWVRTASIGFQPVNAIPNDIGGLDYAAWELLEFSLVPIPANQDALRLAAKSLDAKSDAFASIVVNPPFVVDDATHKSDGIDEDAVVETETNAEQDADRAAADEAAAVDAANELRLAAILSEFVNSIRPYLATTTEG